MRLRFAVILVCSVSCAAGVGGCAGGGSSVTQSAGTVPSSVQRGTVAGDASLGHQAPSGVRRTLSVPTCSGTGTDAFVGGTGSNVAKGGYSFVGAGQNNQACDGWSAIAGGYQNAISKSTDPSVGDGFIGGGEFNVLTGVESNSAIVAGNTNEVSNANSAVVGGTGNSVAAAKSLVGGGDTNKITAAGTDGFIGGGFTNTVSAVEGVIGGGDNNAVSAQYGVIAGGTNNTVSGEGAYIAAGGYNTASGEGAVVDGGFRSTAGGAFATIPGGYVNSAAGSFSFAAGGRASAAQTGTFVWSDSSNGDTVLTSTRPYEFLARASGGFTLWTNSAATVGATLAAGSGTWASASDRNLKTDVARLDDAAVLEKVAQLPISRWSYKSERGVRHVGPMAQDFYAAFGVGEDDKHITSIDEDGVALAAIKALHAHVNVLEAKNAQLRAASASQSARIAAMQAQLQRLSAQVAVLNER
jgi:hypothetical protein